MDLLQNRRFLSCKMSYHIRRTTCARLARRFPLHNKFINPHLLCLGFLFQLSLLKHQSERYHEKDARTPYRPDSELRHGKRTKSSTECEQRDDAKVTFRSEPRPPTAAGQGTSAPFCERTEVPDAHRAGVDITMYLAKRLHLHRACKRNDGVGREVETGRDETNYEQKHNFDDKNFLPPMQSNRTTTLEKCREHPQHERRHGQKIVYRPCNVKCKHLCAEKEGASE